MSSSPQLFDRQACIKACRRLYPLSDASFEQLWPHTSVQRYEKGSFLLKAGDRATQVMLVVSGAVREYYALPDGRDRTRNFALAGEFSGAFSELLTNAPSRVYLLAEQDSRVLCVGWTAYRKLCDQDEQWMRYAARTAEYYYMQKSRREFELFALDAEQRYEALLSERPEIAHHIALRHIASYLGITPVHLSRLRAKRCGR